MFNFIVYEDEEKFREKYHYIILKFIGDSNLAYKIIDISKYTKQEAERIRNLSGNNIYILDIEVPGKSGLDLAREIRHNGDWKSQIIIVTSHDDLKNFDYQSSMLMLAFITKYYDLEMKLYKMIAKAHKILTSDKLITFKRDSKIYNISINDVLLFEKKEYETNAIVVTKDNEYLTDKLLKKWEEELSNDPRFVRTFKNTIVNIYNIKEIDLDRDEITLVNNRRVLLSRNYKKKIKEIAKLLEEGKV